MSASVSEARPTKRRSDAKKEIKASLPRDLRDWLEAKAEELGTSPFRLASSVVRYALEDEKIILAVAPWFQCGYTLDEGRAIIGHLDPDNMSVKEFLEPLLPSGDDVTRFPVKVSQKTFQRVHELAHALMSSKTDAVTILLSEALRMNRISGSQLKEDEQI